MRSIDLDCDRLVNGENLQRVCLYPKRLAGVESGVVLADIAQECALADFCARGRPVAGFGEANVLWADRNLHVVADRRSRWKCDIKRYCVAQLDLTGAGSHFKHFAGNEIDQSHEVGDQPVGGL